MNRHNENVLYQLDKLQKDLDVLMELLIDWKSSTHQRFYRRLSTEEQFNRISSNNGLIYRFTSILMN